MQARSTTARHDFGVQARAVSQAADALGSLDEVCQLLGSSKEEVTAWLDGARPVPRDAFLRAVDFIVKNLAGLDEFATISGSPSFTPKRILVVDDNVDSALALAALLRALGHEPEVAHDGLEALHMAARLRPAIVFLDLILPKLDGVQVAQALRRDPQLARTKIVAVTGHASVLERDGALDPAIDLRLMKPVDVRAIASIAGSRVRLRADGGKARVEEPRR